MRSVRNLVKALAAAGALWLIWFGWSPAYFTLPKDLARPADGPALAALPSGTAFAIEGHVEPTEAAPHEWQGRFAFVHRMRRNVGGSSSKETKVVEIGNHRPALHFRWSGGIWTLAAKSYGLKHAPPVKPRFWPRKWLWTTRVDDWDRSSEGFRPGEAALAYGHIDDAGKPRVEMLMQAPLEAAAAEIGSENRTRRTLLIAAQLVLTLFVAGIVLPRHPSPAA